MTDTITVDSAPTSPTSLPGQDIPAAAPAAVSALPEASSPPNGDVATAVAGEPSDQPARQARGRRGQGGQAGAPQAAPRGQGGRGGDQRQGGGGRRPGQGQGQGQSRGPASGNARPQAPVHPVLLRLRELYPVVFGGKPLPLKLGTFHDLVAAHPDAFDAKELREALGQHTRSSRYLEQVATGVKRHDLQGEPVEDLAPEHVHQAIMEMSRRDRSGPREAAQAKVRLRLRNAFEASGLSRSEYAERVKPPIEEWNALLDHAYAEHGDSGAKREALRRAFEASGLSVEQFASDYGLALDTVQAAVG
ncbi:MAG: hypothetical protein JWQ88_2098 [Rhodoferax sp.]|nr:hypothetical protein [Rhodoferax sp.]